MEPVEIKTTTVAKKHHPTKTHYTLDSIRELFAKENCDITSTEYRNVLSTIEYRFDDKPYRVQLYRWLKKGSRPHLPSPPRPRSHRKKYSADMIRKLFADEGCVLTMPDDWVYTTNQEHIKYTFGGKPYMTTINRWVNFNHRPHK
jgi:hypothetical protein